jgi:DNA-binding NarL/FixJ family response regulator
LKGRILLLEDESDTRDLLGKALTRAGLEVVAAASGEEALVLATKGDPPSVVVADITIGTDDRRGLRLLTELRELGITTPVIVITAYADVDKVKSALNGGAAHLLEKPFRAHELIEAIELVLLRDERSTNVEALFARVRLTEKERVVGRRLLAGLSSDEIAALESNSPKTIRQHITQIYAKCGVSSRAEFFRLAYAR